MGNRIRANYNVDDVNNFLYIWEKTYTAVPSSGVNSFGLEEPYNSFIVQLGRMVRTGLCLYRQQQGRQGHVDAR